MSFFNLFCSTKPSQGCVIWLTGLSGSGKSTIAKALETRFLNARKKVERLDGDSLRAVFPSTGFSPDERNDHVKRVGYMAKLLEKHGVVVIVSLISPYRASRDFVRQLCDNFIEVHVSTPLELCEERDVKGLYAKARKGEIESFTGISAPYEAPLNPSLILDTAQISLEDATDKILKKYKELCGSIQ